MGQNNLAVPPCAYAGLLLESIRSLHPPRSAVPLPVVPSVDLQSLDRTTKLEVAPGQGRPRCLIPDTVHLLSFSRIDNCLELN